jgi:hypothetical protein
MARGGQYVPTLNGKDISPTSFDEARAMEIAKQVATGQSAQHTPTAPGTWTGIRANSQHGCTLSVFGRADSARIWANRADDNALRVYGLTELRFPGDGLTDSKLKELRALPKLSKAQAETVHRALLSRLNP